MDSTSEPTTVSTVEAFLEAIKNNLREGAEIDYISLPEKFIDLYNIKVEEGFFGFPIRINNAYPEAVVMSEEGLPLGRIIINYED